MLKTPNLSSPVTLAKFLDECYMFCGLCILMHVNLKHAFAC